MENKLYLLDYNPSKATSMEKTLFITDWIFNENKIDLIKSFYDSGIPYKKIFDSNLMMEELISHTIGFAKNKYIKKEEKNLSEIEKNDNIIMYLLENESIIFESLAKKMLKSVFNLKNKKATKYFLDKYNSYEF